MVLSLEYFGGIFCVSYFVTTVTKMHDRNTLREGRLALPHGFREISVIMVRKACMGEGTCGSGCSWKRSRGCGEELGVALILKGLPLPYFCHQSPIPKVFTLFKIVPHAGDQVCKQMPIWAFQIMTTAWDEEQYESWDRGCCSDPATTMWNTWIVV